MTIVVSENRVAVTVSRRAVDVVARPRAVNVSLAKGGLTINRQGEGVIIGDDEAVLVAVSSVGSNAATKTRPAHLPAGDYTTEPYKTLSAAVSALPKSSPQCTVTLTPESFAGSRVLGFSSGPLDLVGAWSTPELTTGVTSGTAGAGSGATVVNKPTGAPNWTVNELAGMYFRPTAGDAYFGDDYRYEAAYLILSNSASQLVLSESAIDVDDTTPFEIVEIGTTINLKGGTLAGQVDDVDYLIGVFNCLSDVRLYRLALEAPSDVVTLLDRRASNVELVRCRVEGESASLDDSSRIAATVSSFVDTRFAIEHHGRAALVNCRQVDSSLAIVDFRDANLLGHVVTGDVGDDAAMTITEGLRLELGGSFDDATSAIPIVLKRLGFVNVNGTLTGVSPAVDFAITVEGGGVYNFVGADVVGGDTVDGFPAAVYLENKVRLNWAQISGQAVIEERKSALVWGTGMYVFPGDGIVISGQQQLYAFTRPLGPAYKNNLEAQSNAGVPAYPSSTDQRVGFMTTFITDAEADFDSIRFFDNDVHLDDPLVTGGMMGMIKNSTIYSIALYPPTGHKIFQNEADLGVDTPAFIGPGATVIWMTDDDKNWHI